MQEEILLCANMAGGHAIIVAGKFPIGSTTIPVLVDEIPVLILREFHLQPHAIAGFPGITLGRRWPILAIFPLFSRLNGNFEAQTS